MQPEPAESQGALHGASSSIHRPTVVDGRSVAADCANQAAILRSQKRPNTQTAYATEHRKYEHFLKCWPYDGEDHKAGDPRETNLEDNLTTWEGVVRAAHYIEWIGKNYPGYNTARKPAKLGESTFKSVHSDLMLHFKGQMLSIRNGVPLPGFPATLESNPLYSTTMKNIQATFQQKSHGKRTTDPLIHTAADSVTRSDLTSIGNIVMMENLSASDQQQSIRIWCASTGSRNDEARSQGMHDFENVEPFFTIGDKAHLLSAVSRNGKTHKLQVDHTGCLRDVEPLNCAHFWMGMYYCRRFALDKVPYPDPREVDDWNNRSQWHTPNNNVLPYETCRQSDNRIMKAADIMTSKTCHAWRQYSARQVDDAGCRKEEVERWCNWTPDSATVSYLRSYSRSTLLAAAGWSTSGERMFFSERFHIEVPDSLVDDVAPYLKILPGRSRM